MDILAAGEKDLAELAALWMSMMREHGEMDSRVCLSPNAEAAYHSYLLLHIDSSNSRILKAAESQKIVGFCCGYVCNNLPMFEPARFGYLSDIYLLPPWRGQGGGKEMLKTMEAFFRENGVEKTQLQVYRKNEKGRAFWAQQGYAPFFDRLCKTL